MPSEIEYPTGAPLWMDLVSRDPGASRSFYEGLFGWQSDDLGPDFGGYVVFSLDGKQVGGLARHGEGSTEADFWRIYLETDDSETTAAAVTGAGGMVLEGPHPVASLGTMLLANDVGRAVIASWQRSDNRGFEALATPGAPAWFELHTTDYDDSVQFYQQAFGWQTATIGDSPEFRYTQLMVDEKPYAGIMDASAYWPAGNPAAWLVYVNVVDVDAHLERAVDLGGTIVDPAVDTPFGRMATLSDATGALIKLIS